MISFPFFLFDHGHFSCHCLLFLINLIDLVFLPKPDVSVLKPFVFIGQRSRRGSPSSPSPPPQGPNPSHETQILASRLKSPLQSSNPSLKAQISVSSNHRNYRPRSDTLTETLSCIIDQYPVCYTETDRRVRQTDRQADPQALPGFFSFHFFF